jgi:hypothetical protein
MVAKGLYGGADRGRTKPESPEPGKKRDGHLPAGIGNCLPEQDPRPFLEDLQVEDRCQTGRKGSLRPSSAFPVRKAARETFPEPCGGLMRADVPCD